MKGGALAVVGVMLACGCVGPVARKDSPTSPVGRKNPQPDPSSHDPFSTPNPTPASWVLVAQTDARHGEIERDTKSRGMLIWSLNHLSGAPTVNLEITSSNGLNEVHELKGGNGMIDLKMPGTYRIVGVGRDAYAFALYQVEGEGEPADNPPYPEITQEVVWEIGGWDDKLQEYESLKQQYGMTTNGQLAGKFLYDCLNCRREGRKYGHVFDYFASDIQCPTCSETLIIAGSEGYLLAE